MTKLMDKYNYIKYTKFLKMTSKKTKKSRQIIKRMNPK